MATFFCGVCKADKPVTEGITPGYGVKPDGTKICYDCCAVHDRIQMRDEDRITLYLVKSGEVVNWPGTLRFQPTKVRKGRHNIGKTRIDVWFTEDEFGSKWWGRNIGDSQILHCRKLTGLRPAKARDKYVHDYA